MSRIVLFLIAALTALVSGTNLTVTFDTPGDDCAVNGSSSALTFTTSSIPPSYQCFNLEELFGGNQSQQQRAGSRTGRSAGSSQTFQVIDWVVYNAEPFDSGRNYSHISYLQRNVSEPEEGEDATRLFEVFNGQDCIATGSPDGGLYPWYGWTCQSPEDGSCSDAAYSIASFRVGSAEEISSRKGKCWDAAVEGAAMRNGRPSFGAVSAVLMALALLL